MIVMIDEIKWGLKKQIKFIHFPDKAEVKEEKHERRLRQNWIKVLLLT